MLEFDPAAHRYTFDGKPVPNVTNILASESPYKGLDPAMLEIARQKGQHVHRMIELDLSGALDEATLPEWMKPALTQWRQFVADTGFAVEESEFRVFHPVYRYAGTLDLFGNMNGGPVLIDLKRSFLAGHVTGLQTAAYLEALSAMMKQDNRKEGQIVASARRFALRLREDSRYNMIEFTDKLDRTDFLAALALHNRRSRYA